LQKPISDIHASRCFTAALNFMERERRRYYRQPVQMPVRVVAGEAEIKATCTNISEGGIALKLHEALPKNATPRLHFTLPETSLAMEVESEVAWADMKGYVGLRFLNVPASSQELLETWLDERMGEHLSSPNESPAGSSTEAAG
jgi:c-di-GMP-binding flagellar brake protein YcgR